MMLTFVDPGKAFVLFSHCHDRFPAEQLKEKGLILAHSFRVLSTQMFVPCTWEEHPSGGDMCQMEKQRGPNALALLSLFPLLL